MEHRYSQLQIDKKFQQAIGKTLGEIDKVGDFNRTIVNPKITGIAGDVVEHSILGYPSDTKQKADIIVDDKEFEVKTTGVRGKYLRPETYVAKERITVTHVSPNKIKKETFETSSLWNKLENTILAYYLYDSQKVVPARQYADFPFLGYQLHHFSSHDREVLEKDWRIVQNFCAKLTKIYRDNSPKAEEQAKQYSEAKKSLMYLETAPGWKNGPRFALRKSYVTAIIQEHFGQQTFSINESVNSYADLDEFLSKKSREYKGKAILEIQNKLGIEQDAKSLAHSLITRILNPNVDIKKGEEQFDLIKKSGLKVKAFILNEKGKKKEDVKFINLDFHELNDKSLDVHNSSAFEYFRDTKFLFAIFQDGGQAGQKDDIFKGFKRLSFTEEYLEQHLVPVLIRIQSLLVNNDFKIKPVITKKGKPVFNENKVQKMTNNLPKSSEGSFFLKGTGSDSRHKPLKINGQKLYYQQIWLRGDRLINLLKVEDYL